jgi:hypothetical protein
MGELDPRQYRKSGNNRDFQIEVNERRVDAHVAWETGQPMPDGVDPQAYTPPQEGKTARRAEQAEGLKRGQ